jgi:DNA-directed RNA polymerase sigma subunit (sigma70/sigma32)
MKTAHQKFIEACRIRRDKMLAMKRAGKTLDHIAGKFGITRQRVGQILGKGEK